MEFINCQALDKYFNVVSMGEIPFLAKALLDGLPIAQSKKNHKAQHIFQDKIGSVAKKITVLSQNAKQAILLLEKYDFSNVPQSICHGDMTLENIILSNQGNIYLIDFLDSFYDSWMMDLAKILQDIDLHWSYRHEKMNANLELRLLVAKEEIISRILSMANGKQKLSDIYHILLLNVLRIYPYAKDSATFDFLEGALRKALKRIEALR
jgi:thiamine kinase-like enzyme